jgi:hypothetical protein
VSADRLEFRVTVDDREARIVLNPTAQDPDFVLVVEIKGCDAMGGDAWRPIDYRDTKRFIAAALLYASVFGARPGAPIDVGRVERGQMHIAAPTAYAELLGLGAGVADPSRQLKEGDS